MDLLEYQGKRYMGRWGVPVLDGGLASSPGDVLAVCHQVGFPAVVKAQVPVGGRGKAGGIRAVSHDGEALDTARRVLGMDLSGHRVDRVLVEPAVRPEAELYAALTIDRAARSELLILSSSGGMEIEQVATANPDAVLRVPLEPGAGVPAVEAAALGAASGAVLHRPGVVGSLNGVLKALYRCFTEGDAYMVEVNPLALLEDGSFVALDAKVVLDDNATYRHPEWEAMAAELEWDPRDLRAKRNGLNYVGLSGQVGIVANGAGLAMSTLDVVAQAGGTAANFLDIGGGASAAVMSDALQLVDSDPAVRAILVNIFGGITRCDEVALGIVRALSEVDLRSPIVLRLDGTNSAEGRHILAEQAGPSVTVSASMLEAAATAVRLAGATA
ncbi:MAG: ADP-forming succinate--CoA ligase subunit beta [Actinomycetota bacterium]|nr:ADP-forming succinate--CoA ligase subunit beta [Actinomycetota bacterium]